MHLVPSSDALVTNSELYANIIASENVAPHGQGTLHLQVEEEKLRTHRCVG